jgi:hypothetical protein
MTAQPGDSAAQPAPEPAEREFAELSRRRALHAFDWGVAAAIGVALVYGLLWGVVLLQWGLIAIGVMGGWVIGKAVARGAWKGALHPVTRRLHALSAALALLAWFGAAWVAYLSSRALLESERTFAQRLGDLTFGQYMTEQYMAAGLIHAIALAALVIMGWRSAR